MKGIILLLLFTVSLPLYSQTSNRISGHILNEDGQPILNSNIKIEGSYIGTITDLTGKFEMNNVPATPFVLVVSHLGFMSHRDTISEQSADIRISLIEDPNILPQLFIVGTRDQLFTKTPGSVTYLDQTELNRLQPISGNEVFRRAPGLNVVDEEGAGLRVNIGIRGLDPDRSRSVLMLEDGVPVSLNPYGEPEMYYTPAIDRMSGVEILKGSGQILYGPQTVGGVVNYITAAPPEEQEFGIRVQGGQGGYFTALGSYGNTFNKTGVYINYLHKRADALGLADFTANDFNAKLKFPISDRSTVGIKVGAYREASNSTYVGLTQPMYDQGGNDFTELMPNDELNVSRYVLSFSHRYEATKSFNIQSSLYGYTTVRNWRRQDYVYNSFTGDDLNPPPADWTGEVWGDESVAGGAIYLRNRTGNRDRQFEVVGWEQKINYKKTFGRVSNELTAGYRYLYERAYEQRINGTNAQAKSGTLVSDEIRTGKALAVYVVDKLAFSEKFDITPGVRGEFYNYEREILRDAGADVSEFAQNNIREIIPGIGLNYRPKSTLNFFSGLHRGYAPPRIKDAIDFTLENPVLQLDAERSWNVEVGVRTQLHKGFYAEATYFFMDFDNQIIPSSQSVGGVGFGLTNAGRTLHRGMELSLNMNSRELLNTRWLALVDINATHVNATYNSDRLVTSGNDEINVKNNRLPYAPQWTLSSAFSLEAPFGTGLRLTHTLVGDQFADEVNTITPSNNGRIGLINSFQLIDATLYHKIPKLNGAINISVKNLTDERYISTRRPEGIRVGLPRFVTAGFDIKF